MSTVTLPTDPRPLAECDAVRRDRRLLLLWSVAPHLLEASKDMPHESDPELDRALCTVHELAEWLEYRCDKDNRQEAGA